MSAPRITEHFDTMVREVLDEFPGSPDNAMYEISVGLDEFGLPAEDSAEACDECGLDHVEDLCVRFVLVVSLDGVCQEHPEGKTSVTSQWVLPLVDMLQKPDLFRTEVRDSYQNAVFALQAHSMDDLGQLG